MLSKFLPLLELQYRSSLLIRLTSIPVSISPFKVLHFAQNHLLKQKGSKLMLQDSHPGSNLGCSAVVL